MTDTFNSLCGKRKQLITPQQQLKLAIINQAESSRVGLGFSGFFLTCFLSQFFSRFWRPMFSAFNSRVNKSFCNSHFLVSQKFYIIPKAKWQNKSFYYYKNRDLDLRAIWVSLFCIVLLFSSLPEVHYAHYFWSF